MKVAAAMMRMEDRRAVEQKEGTPVLPLPTIRRQELDRVPHPRYPRPKRVTRNGITIIINFIILCTKET